MNDVMIRFLTSIGIDNFEDFDIEFDSVSMDQENIRQVNMVIRKETPWYYQDINQFQEKLFSVNYPYSLKFKYINKPQNEDVLSLFEQWHLSIYRIEHTYNIKFDKKQLMIECLELNEVEHKKLKQVVNEFNMFLDFLSYDYKVIDSTKVLNKEISSNIGKHIDIEHQENIKEAEKHFIDQMKENDRKMTEERNRIRPYMKGDYVSKKRLSDISIKSDENVDIDGVVFEIDCRVQNNGRRVYYYSLGKGEDAIACRAMEGKLLTADKLEAIKVGMRVRIKGYPQLDYKKGEYVTVHFIDVLPPLVIKEDDAEVKRVELHLHTLMSVMDGVSSIDTYCQIASAMGHKAIAITDHGVLQAFPKAQSSAKKHNIKMIYGVEAYVVDDKIHAVFNPSDINLKDATYVVFDLETTGLNSKSDRVIEFGAVKVKNGMIIESIDILINPERIVSSKISSLTHITNEMLVGKNVFADEWGNIKNFIGDSILVSHNASFDVGFLNNELYRLGEEEVSNPIVDTLALSRYIFKDSKTHNLGALSRNVGLDVYSRDAAHRADYDAEILSKIWDIMMPMLVNDHKCILHSDLDKIVFEEDFIKYVRPYHVTMLAKNKEGLKALYELVSLSHIQYFHGVPKLPRSVIEKNRENLIIGSACFNGEIFELARNVSNKKLAKAMSFYDFIEIQPLGNYEYLVNAELVETKEMVRKFIDDIIEVAGENNKLIVATGDVHYANEDDKIVRDIFVNSKAVGNITHPLHTSPRGKETASMPSPHQHYRTTKEMLDEFKFVGEEKAYEYVVKNSNLIADMIDELKPIPDGLSTPHIENCDVILRDECYKNAREMYGENLPKLIEERLETELQGIIQNGFAVIYYLAMKIVTKATGEGFIVGSRGSVGSSFVATMAKITEVNPLPPHYVCPKCKKFILNEDESIFSGFDLPTKKCPECENEMIGDGQNIPFETFLGFEADKVPDIDLNFSSDYQAIAHNYVKELLGDKNCFRAGTIGTVAQKTAFGYVKNYYKLLGIEDASYVKTAYLAYRCTGVKRTTGQHPGGIIVIPNNFDVSDFTPIQFPADAKDADWMTSHFDFKAIHDNVLKLDLLGHVDPMALKSMCDLTGISLSEIPINDEKVISLFTSDKELKKDGNIEDSATGSLGIPEFGTEFVQGLLKVAKPKSVSDLIIISGLSHGTDVWKNNAESLLKEKVVNSLQDVIGCRDDIMTYLISKGIPAKMSFSIMEDVRKGKRLKPEYEEIMKENNIPMYYIDSCNKIKYMFPKAHATAYVTQALRVGYFKIYKPLAFYATYFSVRCEKYDIEAMVGGKQKIEAKYQELKKIKNSNTTKLSTKEASILDTLTIALEMVERGFTFANIDLDKSEAMNFIIDYDNNCLIPPFNVLDGLGENAALSIVEARKVSPFTSREDLSKRTKLSSTTMKMMDDLGVLHKLTKENDEISLFDFDF